MTQLKALRERIERIIQPREVKHNLHWVHKQRNMRNELKGIFEAVEAVESTTMSVFDHMLIKDYEEWQKILKLKEEWER